MSVLARSRTDSSQVETYQTKRSDVVGTATIPLGYKLRQQIVGAKYPELKTNQLRLQGGSRNNAITRPQHPQLGDRILNTQVYDSVIPTDRRFYSNALLCDDKKLEYSRNSLTLKERTDKTIRRNQIRDCIQKNTSANEEDINIRRAKLRNMISSEEALLSRELVNLDHKRKDTRAEEAAKQDELHRMREEEERRHLVTSKRQQQYFENSPEARDKMSREIARGVKFANLAQILEKNSRHREEKQLDQLWHEIMSKEAAAQKQHENNLLAKRRAREKETGSILSQQMAARSSTEEELRRQREEERQELENLWAQVREEEVRNLEAEKLKREKFKRDLEEQLTEARKQFADKMKQEKEISSYMKYLEELKAEQAKRKEEVEAIIEQSARDIEARRDLARKQYQEHQARLRHEIIRARDDQLKAKRDLEAKQRRKVKEEREVCRKDAQLAAAASVEDVYKKKEMARRYRQELQAQLELQEINKRRDAIEDMEKYQRALKEQDEYEKFKDEVVKKPDFIPIDAFKFMMKECAARQDSKQKNF
ncbi:trichohyalin-like [Microplitis demolitor]|uniref:trichohyalin-like n=1 Tax=Microplitis demolitor TaxID=69319 RepID=UPI00235B68D1|nr:trichohyalin-like [Microplitis demolitor]